MTIGACDLCGKHPVPIARYDVAGIETWSCFPCAGDDDPDPYGELLPAPDPIAAIGAEADHGPAPDEYDADDLDPMVREMACPACGGDGTLTWFSGGYDPRDGSANEESCTCSHCRGRGGVWEPVQVRDLDDMEAETTQ